MVELRRTRVGPITEWPSREGDVGPLVTLHDLNDAVHRWKHEGDESRIRALVRPIESCMTGIKRVIIKDAAVDAVCHGAMLAVPGVLSLSPGIKKGETVVLLSGKGELVAIAEAGMTTDEISGKQEGHRVPGEAGDYGGRHLPKALEDPEARPRRGRRGPGRDRSGRTRLSPQDVGRSRDSATRVKRRNADASPAI